MRMRAPSLASTDASPGLTYEHDLFVIHAELDGAFVEGVLLPRLGLPDGRVLLSTKLPLGGVRVAELVHGVQTSAWTVAVLSSAYLAERWTQFAHTLAAQQAGTTGRLIPVLLDGCAVPLDLDIRVKLEML